MITTTNIKQAQHDGVFTVGHKGERPAETVLVIGSCRAVPYVNYLNRFNLSQGEPWRIHCIDPGTYSWLQNGERQDSEKAIEALETNEGLLQVFRSATIFVHEFYKFYGLFACSKDAPKNIYQYGLSPRLDVLVPNHHDLFILFQEIVAFDDEAKGMARFDLGIGPDLSPATVDFIKVKGLAAVQKFCDICRK